MRLRRCALQQTLADKNSILGRHGDSAAQLIFSLRFLHEVDDCTALLRAAGDTELANSLQQAKAAKRAALPQLLFRALLAGPEFRQLWHSPEQQRQAYPPGQRDRAVLALQRWQQLQLQWLSASHYHHYSEVIGLLNDIRHGMGGELLRFQHQALSGLTRANALLTQRVAGRPLCLSGAPTAQAIRYQALLKRRFIADLQPLAALASRHQHQLMAALSPLEETLDRALQAHGAGLPAAYRQWRSQRDALLKSVQDSHRQHVLLNSQLIAQCGLTLGAAP